MNQDRPLLTVKQLAAYLAVERKTIYRLPIPYVLVGQRRRYKPEDVDTYLATTVRPTPGV